VIPGALTNSFLGSLGVASYFVGFGTAVFCFDDFLLGLFELPSCCLSLGGTLLYFLFLYHIYDATISRVLCWFCWLEFAILGGVLIPSSLRLGLDWKEVLCSIRSQYIPCSFFFFLRIENCLLYNLSHSNTSKSHQFVEVY
jgi:hypothetical protein